MKANTKSMMQLVATSIDIHSEMEAFHKKICKNISYEFRHTIDEDGMWASNMKGIEMFVWPRRVFFKDLDIIPRMRIPAITICLN